MNNLFLNGKSVIKPYIILFLMKEMNQRVKRPLTLPDVTKGASYVFRSINTIKSSCYDETNKLQIDQGYGDYNMRIFRLKQKRKYVKNIPTAFTPVICDLLQYKASDANERRIATEHNEAIKRILTEPKEVYLQKIKQQRELQKGKEEERRLKYQYVKGKEKQTREFKQHLSFNYLSKYQADKWFDIQDNSSTYNPLNPSFTLSIDPAVKTSIKKKKQKGFIFISDSKKDNPQTTIK